MVLPVANAAGAPTAARWDRLVLRLIASAGVVMSLWPVIAAVWRDPTPAGVITVISGLVVAGALPLASLHSSASAGAGGDRARSLIVCLAVAAAAPLTGALTSIGSTAWIPYIGVLAAAGSPLGLVPALGVAIPSAAVLIVRSWLSSGHDPWSVAVTGGLAVVAFAIIWSRRQVREAEELAAARLVVIAQERARAEADARQREVAAQVHDVLAHTLSGLIITLQGAAVAARRDGDSDKLTNLLSTATDLAREGLAGAQRAVETLHGNPAASPDSDLAGWLATTTERLARATGLRVDVTGDPADVPDSWRDLSRSVVLEGLTNALRHAPGAAVDLVFLADDGLRLRTGAPAPGALPVRHGGGYGLTGLARRVHAHGGTMSYGPTVPPDPDGFELAVTFGSRR